jgi:hypothetical protein
MIEVFRTSGIFVWVLLVCIYDKHNTSSFLTTKGVVMIDREHILTEIRRLVTESAGSPPGQQRFESETRIRAHEWGRYWARWGDALIDAGFKPNVWTQKLSDEEILETLVEYARELGKFPTFREMRLKALRDTSFPSKTPFRRFGSQRLLATRLREYCLKKGYEDVVPLCESVTSQPAEPSSNVSSPQVPLGFVYLIKSGRFYKIGRSNAVGRRERELDIILPEVVKVIHSIKTDDPPGIEDYWHRRFENCRKKGEWFELSAQDVAAFRRRKFM